MASLLPQFQKYRTGEKGTVTHVIANATPVDGTAPRFDTVGDVYKIPLGDLLVLLHQLLDQQRRLNTFWGRYFLSSGLERLEIKLAIDRLQQQLNQSVYEWVE